MNEEFWEHTPDCARCGWKLCFLDRQYDECPMCCEPIPQQLRVS